MDKVNIILSEKQWHSTLSDRLNTLFDDSSFVTISDKNDFNLQKLEELNPVKIFIPHWSYIIPKEIFENYECIVFHMTDLPYGRGGSPLQNLIVRGYKTTKISALKVEEGIDSGPVYVKKDLDLSGTAQDIFDRGAEIVFEMIEEIIERQIIPIEQKGEVTEFKRRTPDMSDVSELDDISKVYDYIRMLDAEGYPKAFIESDHLRFEFRGATTSEENTITANVRITKK